MDELDFSPDKPLPKLGAISEEFFLAAFADARVEKIKKTDANTLTWTVTVEDSEFFTKPFTYSFTKTRAEDASVSLGNSGPAYHLMPIYCEENKDDGHMLSTPGFHKVEPKFQK